VIALAESNQVVSALKMRIIRAVVAVSVGAAKD
jgi:hypothetical protein